MSVPSIAEFSSPPVVEVVCGVQFSPLPGFLSPHVGLFWGQLGPSFAQARDVPPLPFVTEHFDVSPGRQSTAIEMTFGQVPQLPRVQFRDEKAGEMVQVQNGRFHLNWQKRHAEDEYRRYEGIRPAFLERWRLFRSFVESTQLGLMVLTQYELSYTNHIEAGELWDDDRGLAGVLPWFSPRIGFLDSTNFAPEFALHTAVPKCHGRLHVTGKTGWRHTDLKRVFSLDLIVRGPPANPTSDDDLAQWMDSARECIVRSFVELTSDRARKYWGQTR